MDENPPEIEMKLGFTTADIQREFIRLFKKCLESRRFGMEQRMDHNRDLMELRSWMREKGEYLKDKEDPDREVDFNLVCEWLDYAPDDARRRIARVQTWDMIRDYLDSNGASAQMPIAESHVDALFDLEIEKRGPAWAKFYDAAIAARVPITRSNIQAWVKDYQALPAPEPEITFEDDEPEEETEVTHEDVPQGTKPAVAAEVPPMEPAPPAPPSGRVFRHPARIQEAIETIAKACGGADKERVTEWTALLSDPVKIDFQALLQWADHSPEDIRRIASLATGNLHKGLRAATRIVEGVIDARTTVSFLVNRCRADGGRLEHVYGPYKITITYEQEKDYES